MRIVIALAIVAFLAAPASAAPFRLADHAALSKEAITAPVQAVRYKAKYNRYATAAPRRCGWQCTPYWRPYQYRYWQFYYPYGGPLF